MCKGVTWTDWFHGFFEIGMTHQNDELSFQIIVKTLMSSKSTNFGSTMAIDFGEVLELGLICGFGRRDKSEALRT